MVRCQMNFKRLSLTDIKIDIKRIPKKATLIKAMEEADVKTKWENSSWGKKLVVQKRRASLNDFDRFKVMLAKIKVRHFTTIWFISVGHDFFHLLNLSFFI
uniref:Large ribosomal subunit protein eL14 domain-containing protein n=1 Tax=Aegilops tauschii subsp. strangulata TaxID=200361 RepID=A0A453P404_AEGTS